MLVATAGDADAKAGAFTVLIYLACCFTLPPPRPAAGPVQVLILKVQAVTVVPMLMLVSQAPLLRLLLLPPPLASQLSASQL